MFPGVAMATQQDYEAEFAVERDKRIQLLRATRDVLARKLRKHDSDTQAPLKDVVAGIRMVSDELRMEFKAASAVPDDDDRDQPTIPPDPLSGLRVLRPTG